MNTKWTLDAYGNSVRIAATADANGVRTFGDNSDWRSELEAYNKERDIKRLMMNRVGVCG